MAKACLFYLLRKMKHDVSSEWRTPKGYVDLCDKTTRTFYEIEFHPSAGIPEGEAVYCVSEDEAHRFSVGDSSPKFRSRKFDLYRVTGYEVIVIDCSRIPLDMEGMKEYLDQYIIPD